MKRKVKSKVKSKEIKIRKSWDMNPSQQVHKDKKAYKRSDNKRFEKGDEE